MRVVHHGSDPVVVEVKVSGSAAAAAGTTARDPKATTLASDDLDAENTAANVDFVSPRAVPVKVEDGGVSLVVPGQSFTVIEM